MAESTRVAWQVDHMILNVIVDDLLLASVNTLVLASLEGK